MDELKIGFDTEGTFAVDLKMLNLLLGLQSHASKHPCPWCEGSAPWTTRARLRTLGNIQENQQRYVKSGKGRDKLMQFKNCEHPSLIVGSLDKPILMIFPPPQLHLYMGATNHIKKGIHAALENLDKNCRTRSKTRFAEAFKEWCAHNGLHAVDYWNKDLQGPKCRKLLEKSEELAKWLPTPVKMFAICLQRLYEVKEACFGMKLYAGYDKKIIEFEKQFDKLGISKINKIHAIITHVPEFIKMVGNKPLGIFSEQAMESVHHDFEETWKDYKREEIAMTFHEQLHKCVVKYNSMHL